MKTGVELIAEERQRQIDVEHRTPENDDEHTDCELAYAAMCYAMPNEQRISEGMNHPDIAHDYWPWHPSWWKPTPNDRIRELQKAGALIAAEIDRLQRLKQEQI